MPDRVTLSKNFWKRLRAIRAVQPEVIADEKRELRHYCANGDVSGVLVSAESLAMDSICLAIIHGEVALIDQWTTIRDSLSLLYWMNEIDIHDFVKSQKAFGFGDSHIYSRCFFHSMMLQSGADSTADWIAPFMLNVFRSGGWFAEDKEFGRFYELLLHTQISGRWDPRKVDSAGLSPEVVRVLNSLSDAAELRSSLVDYADWRLARANGYPNFLATKKKGHYVFSETWWGVFPFELFAVQSIYRRFTGQEISLDAEHPLLQTPLMKPPPLKLLDADEDVMLVKDFLQRTFGKEWQPLAPVALITV